MSKVCEYSHLPVLLSEVITWLNIRPNGCYVDCTLGGAGHAAAIAARLGPAGRLIGIDQDEDALRAAQVRIADLGLQARFDLIAGNFADLDDILDCLGLATVDGILADLGVSSWQLDRPERGFGYRLDGPLDMRMNRSADLTAEIIVNTWSVDALTHILRSYGEERFAGRISRAIAARRDRKPFSTTTELAETVITAMPAASRREAQHPARRTFQALRMAVNDELGVLEQLLQTAPQRLSNEGRLCLITFHSLEDRRVKQAFQTLAKPCICPRDFPVCACGRVPQGRILTKRPVAAAAEEQAGNPRARSARLRCFERQVSVDPNEEVEHGLH